MSHYKRLEKIGQGGRSTVYKAVDTITGEVVAIKQLVKEAGFPRREVVLSRQVTHKHVCRIHDYFQAEDGSICIVMEYVGGGTLRILIEKAAPMSRSKALSIAEQILDGLEAAHSEKVVHRDLKPENVLLTENGVVKISDFGLAREIRDGLARESGDEHSRLTVDCAGTPPYTAPEQRMGKECDARTDIYAFGLILGELLGDQVPERLQAVIERCLKRDPSLRFASVAELRRALKMAAPKPKLVGILAVSAITLLLAAIPVWHRFAAAPPRPPVVDATGPPAQVFKNGRYFLDNGFAADALAQFDALLSMAPEYPEAHYYRGLALENLNRLDEAIDAFKRALPRADPERRVLSSWDAPPTEAEHGIIRGFDNIQVHHQRDFFENRKDGLLQKAIIYGERNGGSTVLHFPNLDRNRDRRIEIPDETIALDAVAKANGAFIILTAANRFYGFSADGTLLWHKDLTDYGPSPPKSALIGDTFYIYSPALKRFDLFNAETGNLLWRKDDFAIEPLDPPMVRKTKVYGDILIARSADAYRAIRKSDGSPAWIAPVESPKASSLANDRLLIVFEPERRIFTVDFETGKTVSELALEQFVDALKFRTDDIIWLAGALLDGNTLYVISKDLELYAISIDRLRILWQSPIHKNMQAIRVHGNHLYVGTNDGELIVMDVATGAITRTTRLTGKGVLIDYAGDDAVIVGSSDKTLFGLDPAGVKKWEYPSVDPLAEATYFNGTVTVYTSPLQMSALDVVTGKVLWQYASARPPDVFVNDGRFYVVEEKGVKEYAIGPVYHTVTDKQALTELARVYQAKGDLNRSRIFVEKASEIDANYPPLALVRSRLSKAEGRRDEARQELAGYASLVGLDSKEGQNAVSELKRDYGLLWESAINPDVAGDPFMIANRLVSVGRRVDHEVAIVALDPETGAVVWSYTGERYIASVAAPPFVWYVSSSQSDGTLLNLYRIDVRSGERNLIESRHNPTRVEQAWIALDSGRARILTDPPLETKRKEIPPRSALWAPSAFMVDGKRLYAYTSDGHAYAMQLN